MRVSHEMCGDVCPVDAARKAVPRTQQHSDETNDTAQSLSPEVADELEEADVVLPHRDPSVLVVVGGPLERLEVRVVDL